METQVQLSDITMNVRSAGEGPLLLLLHGWPQTSYCWRKVTPALAQHFRVVAPDLRGYGHSDKPVGDYTKRRMAADVRELVDVLGYDRVQIVGHDRGGRVAHRFALDHADVLTHLTVLDITPTLGMVRNATYEVAAGYWHWLFHQRPDLPELLAGANVDGYLRYLIDDWTFQHAAMADGIPHYVEAFSRPGALRAGFDDYRATPQDVELDQADQDAGHRVELPVQVLWGDAGLAAGAGALDAWRDFAPAAFGRAVAECGHFIAEEQPEQLVEAILAHHPANA